MKRKTRFTSIPIFLVIVFGMGLSTTVFARSAGIPALQQSSLPQIEFLGQGPQTFTVEPPRKFLVKTYQNGVFLFVTVDEPTYQAERNERVWTTDFVPAEPMRLFHESRSYGNVAAGCVVNYVQIEDNLDNRRNTFYINGEVLQVVEQGMVTYGTFTVPEAGELTFYAEDSIGMVVELCPTEPTVVVSPSPTSTGTLPTALPFETGTPEASTPTSTPTLSATPTDTATATASASATATSTATTAATATATATDAATSTATQQPTALVVQISPTPSATSTNPPANPTQTPTTMGGIASSPTASPRPSSTVQVIVITATPISTPGVLPTTGGGPGPREIAAISAGLMGLFGLLAAGWWLLLRAYGNQR